MSSLSDYKARVTGNLKISQINNTKNLIIISFKNSPSYYPVTVNTAASPSITSNLDSWVTDDPNKTKEVKEITLIPNQTLNYGDMIYWLGDYWLTTTVDYMGGMYYRGSMQKCYSSLKWLDSTGSIKTAYFIQTKDYQTGLGINDGKIIAFPNERRYFAIQNNVDTLKITKNQRFIFDNGRCWRVTSINTLLTGLIELELEEMEVNALVDNVALRIANYSLHNYSISIANGTTATIVASSALQLNVTTKDNGVVTTLPVTYSSSNNAIATVSANGLVASVSNGSAVITATLTSIPTISTTFNLTVTSTLVNNYVASVIGSDNCMIMTSELYTLQFANNGIVDTTKTFTYQIFASDGVSVTTLASILSSTTSSVTIKGNTTQQKGDIVLKATCNEIGSVVGTKVIHIKGLT